MSIQAHIDSLASKRTHLKELITLESSRPCPDFALITSLKKQNLALKEEMQRYFVMIRQKVAATSS